MEGTLEKVGDWAVKALPALLEISKKGGRFDLRDLDSLRPSFRAGGEENLFCIYLQYIELVQRLWVLVQKFHNGEGPFYVEKGVCSQ